MNRSESHTCNLVRFAVCGFFMIFAGMLQAATVYVSPANDGDGKSDLTIFDENTGRWFIRALSGKTIAWNVNWGWPGVQPIGK